MTLSTVTPWRLVAAVFAVLTVSSGFGFYNLSIYMHALAHERELEVGALSGAVAVLFIASGIAGLAIGRLIERVDVRWIMAVGAALGALALALVGTATATWQIWLLYALFGFGNSGVSLVPSTTVVTRWFPGANRSLAMSVASTGLSAGGALISPVCAQFLHAFEIGAAMPWFAAIYFFGTAPVALLMIRSWPDAARPATHRRASTRTALRTRLFLGTLAAHAVVMAAQVGAISHQFNHIAKLTDHVVGAIAVSALAACSVAGRIAGGLALTAGMPIRPFTLGNIAGQSLGLAILADADSAWSALLGTVLFGITVGNLLTLQPLLLVQVFGARRYPRLYAITNAAATLGFAFGPLLLGIIHDMLNYAWAFAAAAATSAAAFALFAAAGRIPSR